MIINWSSDIWTANLCLLFSCCCFYFRGGTSLLMPCQFVFCSPSSQNRRHLGSALWFVASPHRHTPRTRVSIGIPPWVGPQVRGFLLEGGQCAAGPEGGLDLVPVPAAVAVAGPALHRLLPNAQPRPGRLPPKPYGKPGARQKDLISHVCQKWVFQCIK